LETPDSGLVSTEKSWRLRSSERYNRGEGIMNICGVTRRSLAALVAVPLGLFVVPTFGADIAPKADGPRLAIEGFDIVAYHNADKPVRGSLEYQTIWHDARWQFATKENLDIFVENPETYAEHHDDPIDAR
jgi:hypothetical protein